MPILLSQLVMKPALLVAAVVQFALLGGCGLFLFAQAHGSLAAGALLPGHPAVEQAMVQGTLAQIGGGN